MSTVCFGGRDFNMCSARRLCCYKVNILLFLLLIWISFGNTAKAKVKGHLAFDSDETSSDEKRLTRHLVRNYKKIGIEGRPVRNASDSMKVMFGLNMMQMDLEEQQNTLSTSVWCRIRWMDDYLTWDPGDYGGISTVRLSSKKIWIPDIMLYNTADTQMMERDVLVVVKFDGSMLWIPHRIYRSSCKVDVTHFPFDQQRCHMTFGSWAYDGNEIDLQFHDDFERMDLSDLERENTEWEVLEKAEKRVAQVYDCCEEPYVTLTFTLSMKRKLVFSSFILTLPCIFLALMTLVVFWLPPERPDRTPLAMNLFSCFLLLLLILVEAAPPTASSVPTLGIYYCFNMVLIMLSIFLSSAVININRKGEGREKVPHWLHVICINWLAKLFGITLIKARNHLLKKSTDRGGVESNNGENATLLTNHHRINSTYANSVQSTHYYATNCHSAPPLHNPTTMTTTVTSSSDNNNHPPLPGGGCDERQSDSGISRSNNDEGVTSLLDLLHHSQMDSKLYKVLKCHVLLMEKCLKKVEKNTRELVNVMRETEHKKQVRLLRLEWQIVATAMDRVLFIIFLIAILSSLFTLFPRPYQLQHG